jgi:hypothetical protein
MIGDVFSQIYEQRYAASLAGKILKSEKTIAKALDELDDPEIQVLIK